MPFRHQNRVPWECTRPLQSQLLDHFERNNGHFTLACFSVCTLMHLKYSIFSTEVCNFGTRLKFDWQEGGNCSKCTYISLHVLAGFTTLIHPQFCDPLIFVVTSQHLLPPITMGFLPCVEAGRITPHLEDRRKLLFMASR